MPHSDSQRTGNDSNRTEQMNPADEPKHELDPQALEMALMAAEMGDARKAADVHVLDLRGHSVIADYFVVMTGFNRRQIQSIAWEFDREMKRRGIKKIGVEGYDTAWWVLIDYGAVVVHILHADAREYYDLDMLWGDAETLDWQEHLRQLGRPPLPPADAVSAADSDLVAPSEGPAGAEYEPGTPPEQGPGIDPEEYARLQEIASIEASARDDDDAPTDGEGDDDRSEADFDLNLNRWRGEHDE